MGFSVHKSEKNRSFELSNLLKHTIASTAANKYKHIAATKKPLRYKQKSARLRGCYTQLYSVLFL